MTDSLDQLASLIESQREPLLLRWREEVRKIPSARQLDTPRLNDHIPRLLTELTTALRAKSEETISEALLEGSSPAHGLQRVEDGYDIEEVVAEYNILRGAIHDLADEKGITLQGRPFHIMNRVLDGAIGIAVQRYATQRAFEIQKRREEYLAFLAHDLRTPLNAISLATRLLERTVTDEKNGPQSVLMLQGSLRNINQLSGLVDKILKENVSLLNEMGVSLQKRRFELWPLIETLIESLQPVAHTSGTKLLNEVPHGLMVFADASLVGRVFQNLMANAISSTPKGTVVIGASSKENGEPVECWVSDNGSGIRADRLEAVFEKLESDREEGLGLGLAIVKGFVEAHDGKVTVRSKEGEGSTFHFTLPGVE